MIRSYNHKGFVLEVSIQTIYRLVSAKAHKATETPEAPGFLAIVTISRSGRPVIAFSPLSISQNRIGNFASAEDALMSARTAAQHYVNDWVAASA